MSGWLRGLVGYMIMVSVVMQMLPNSKYEQYVKLFTGLLLILLLIQPVLKIGSLEDYLENKISQLVKEQEQLEWEIGRKKSEVALESDIYESSEAVVKIPEILKVEVRIGDEKD